MEFDIKRYANLAKIKLSKEEEDRYQKDLEEILGHVDELKKVNTKGVEPMTGGTNLRNVFRSDAKRDTTEAFDLQFPVEENGLLKVPKVLDQDAK